MYTSCPECGTVFRLGAGDLRVAEGYVRCGHCSAIFNALLSLSESPPEILEPLPDPAPDPVPDPVPDPAPPPPPEPPVEPGEWSTLFDEEDLREVTSRMAVEAETLGAWPGDGDEEEEDPSPVYLIDETDGTTLPAEESPLRREESAPAAATTAAPEPGQPPGPAGEADQFGPWAWEPTGDSGPSPGEPASDYPPPRPVEPPAPDLWAEEFGDVVIDVSPGEAEPATGGAAEPALPETAEETGVTMAVASTAMPGPAGDEAGDFPLTPQWAREPLTQDGEPPLRDPGDPGALPPLWTHRPGGWDYPAEGVEDDGGHRWAWGLGSALLALLLGLQIIHQQRDQLATHPTLGPALRQAYGAAGLPLHPQWNLGAYEIRGTEAVAGRSQAGALDVLARIHIVGSEAVGLPLVRVTLRDRFGRILGSRVLEPREYLERGSTLEEPLAPGTVLPVRVSLADPGSEAHGYEVDVCLENRGGSLRCQSERAPFRP